MTWCRRAALLLLPLLVLVSTPERPSSAAQTTAAVMILFPRLAATTWPKASCARAIGRASPRRRWRERKRTDVCKRPMMQIRCSRLRHPPAGSRPYSPCTPTEQIGRARSLRDVVPEILAVT